MTARRKFTGYELAAVRQACIEQLDRELRLTRARIDNLRDPLGMRRDWILYHHYLKRKRKELS